jgi:hypothetical protein
MMKSDGRVAYSNPSSDAMVVLSNPPASHLGCIGADAHSASVVLCFIVLHLLDFGEYDFMFCLVYTYCISQCWMFY